MKVNVGTIGHVDHGKTTLTTELLKLCSEVVQDGRSIEPVRAPELDGIRIRHIGVKKGKGQRKANKANMWR